MGAWGGGLYSSDFSMDLKGAIGGLTRLPVSDADLVALLWAEYGRKAEGVEAQDFWLVLADQFERRGMTAPDVFHRAITIVLQGYDLAALVSQGADKATLSQRGKSTAVLVERLRNPRPAKPRRPLERPEPLLLGRGDVLAWPTHKGEAINPYFSDAMLQRVEFSADGFGLAIVVHAAHEFGFLAAYGVQVLKWERPERPDAQVAVRCARSRVELGTTSKRHLARSRVEIVGRVPQEVLGPAIDPNIYGARARSVALNRIDLSNAFIVSNHRRYSFPFPPLSGRRL